MASITRGRVYTVRARRPDGVFTTYRTCDRSEALAYAEAMCVRVTF